MNLEQEKAYQVETLFRSYVNTDGAGWFSEPFLTVTFVSFKYDGENVLIPGTALAGTIEANGAIPLINSVPITLDCKAGGENITNIYVNPGDDFTQIFVYWTKYTGFKWQEVKS